MGGTGRSHSRLYYLRYKQLIAPYLNDYAPRIGRKELTTHKQTIRAKLTGIYAMEGNYLC